MENWSMELNADLNLQLQDLLKTPFTAKTIGGGDIGDHFKIETQDQIYFLKSYKQKEGKGMVSSEIRGLNALRGLSTSIIVPRICYSSGENPNSRTAFLLLEYIETSNQPFNWRQLAHGLAQIHKVKPERSFGYAHTTFLANVPFEASTYPTFVQFYITAQLDPVLSNLTPRISTCQRKTIQDFKSHLPKLFEGLKPSFVHGDLWSGNILGTEKGIAMIDPSFHIGHREADLALLELFTMVPQGFYDSYQQTFPLSKGWEKRRKALQVFPLLIHAQLFGESYLHQALNTMLISR